MACLGRDWCILALLIRGILCVTFAGLLQRVHGEPVHLMSVTPTPFGAAQDGASFICLLSDPDTDKLDSITTQRLVSRGNNDLNTFELPGATEYTKNITISTYKAYLPSSEEAQGLFYCEASDSMGAPTRVPVTLLHYDRHFEPTDGQFTVTASVGDPVNLRVNMRGDIPDGLTERADILWQKQAEEDSSFIIYGDRSDLIFNFTAVTSADSGVYATYWTQMRTSEFRFSLMRLIVRECSAGRWGPPSCTGICNNCYNGGICDDKTGECVCRPGFIGPNCLRACGTDQFGWDCEHECGPGKAVTSCPRSVFCMPDPVGCSCMTGWMRAECNEECPVGKFGAGCTEMCHCLRGSCERFTGRCRDGACGTGWSGDNCQIPETCPSNYFDANCTAHKPCFLVYWGPNCQMECHCLNGAACDKEKGKCEADVTTGLSLCEPGFVSDMGVNLNNCKQDVGCFDDCTRTCHCKEGSDVCDLRSGVCSGNKGCTVGWIGPLCQTGIVSLTYKKTNPGQLVNVTCIVTSDPVPTANQVYLIYANESGIVSLTYKKTNPVQPVNVTCIVTSDPIPNADQVHLIYVDGSGIAQREPGTQAQTMELGEFLILVYGDTVAEHSEVKCSFLSGGRTVVSIRHEFYKLPTLSRALSSTAVTSTSVTLQWHAWDPDAGDMGDGPVIGYNMYYVDIGISTLMTINAGFVSNTQQKPGQLSGTIASLKPNTAYVVFVTAAREGSGGEGAASPSVSITTLPTPNQTPTPSKLLTTGRTISSAPTSSTELLTMLQSTAIAMQPTPPTEQPSTTEGKTTQRTSALKSTIQLSTLEGITTSITTQFVTTQASAAALMSSSQASSTQTELNITSITEASSMVSIDTDFTSFLISKSGIEMQSQVPSMPSDLQATGVGKTSIILEWEEPAHTNIIILDYSVKYRALQKPYAPNFEPSEMYISIVVEPDKEGQTILVEDLQPSTKYEFKVSGRTSVGGGTEAVIEIFTKLFDLQQPDPPMVVTAGPIARIEFDILPIYVSNVYVSLEVSGESIRKRRQGSLNFESLIVANLSRGDIEESASFTVGDNQTYGGYVNKPLIAGVTYIVRVAHASCIPDECAEQWSKFSVITAPDCTTGSCGRSAGPVIGGSVGGLIIILIIIVVIVIFILNRRKKPAPANISAAMEIYDEIDPKEAKLAAAKLNKAQTKNTGYEVNLAMGVIKSDSQVPGDETDYEDVKSKTKSDYQGLNVDNMEKGHEYQGMRSAGQVPSDDNDYEDVNTNKESDYQGLNVGDIEKEHEYQGVGN